MTYNDLILKILKFWRSPNFSLAGLQMEERLKFVYPRNSLY